MSFRKPPHNTKRAGNSSVRGLGALVVGLAAGVVCSYAVSWKFRLNYDDSLDVVGVHLVGGIIGTLLIGLFATETMTGGAEGLLYGGGLGQLGRQLVAVVAVGRTPSPSRTASGSCSTG